MAKPLPRLSRMMPTGIGNGLKRQLVRGRRVLGRIRQSAPALWVRPYLNSLAARLLGATLLIAAIVLPATTWLLMDLYRNAVIELFDSALYRDLEKLLVNDQLKSLLARLSDSKTVLDRPLQTAPETLRIRGGDPFNLLARQFHWQVKLLSHPNKPARQPPRAFTLLAPTLEGHPLKLPSMTAAQVPADGLFRGYQFSPVSDDDGKRPKLRVLETHFEIGEGGQARNYAFAVAEDVSEIEANIYRFRTRLRIAFTLLGLALIVALFWVVRFGLAPLSKMRKALEEIRAGRSTKLEGTYPMEIAPLQRELNTLLKSKENIIERARTHVGNLAHALKTPLSVITNEARASEGALAEQVQIQAETMRQQINHYLDRARVAALSGVIGEVTEVCPKLERLCQVLEKIYADKGVQLSLTCPAGARFRGEAQDFEEMAGNLLDNACKWATRQVKVTVQRDQVAQQLLIIVEDDGPGLSDPDKAKVLERGRRLDTQAPGSGLGLSIVVDLAGMYDGQLQLTDAPTGGLRAQLRLPAA